MKESLFYSKLKNDFVRCELCPHFCVISENGLGLCKVRKNIAGKLYSLNYGKTVAFGVDPIEKKPLYHFYPGSLTLSIATTSCNFKCQFCQNHEISQSVTDGRNISPELILDYCKSKNIKIVSFTYTEPTIWFEFILDACKILKANNIKTVLVTNGYINPKPFELLSKFIDAMNIDLKSFNNDFYKDICGGTLAPVLQTIKTAFQKNIHIEITNLVITDLNDNADEFRDLVNFIKNINNEIPLHISRYFPVYLLKNKMTSLDKMLEFYEISRKDLSHVYLGNINNDAKYSKTVCPDCGTVLIDRNQYNITENFIVDGKCPQCGRKIYGYF